MYNLIDQKYAEFHANFEALKIIGRGSFGTVFKVKNKHTQELLAVKKLTLKQVQEID